MVDRFTSMLDCVDVGSSPARSLTNCPLGGRQPVLQHWSQIDRDAEILRLVTHAIFGRIGIAADDAASGQAAEATFTE